MTIATKAAVLAAMLLAAPAGCYTGIEAPQGAGAGEEGDTGNEEGDASGGDSQDDGSDGSGGEETCEGCLGDSPLNRLMHAELVGVVSQAFASVADDLPFSLVPGNASIGLFESNHLAITDDGVARHADFAETAAPIIIAEQSCEDTACAEAFIVEAATTLFRRAPTDEETATFVGLLQPPEGVSEWSLQNGMRLAVSGLLQAPQFLYKVEVGTPTDDPKVRALTGREISNRLSLFIWRQAPSAALIEAAKAGELDTAQGVAEQARAMLTDPRADAMYLSFFDRLLELRHFGEQPRFIEGSAEADDYPGLSALQGDMRGETDTFVLALMHSSGSYEELLAADYTFASDALAAYYGAAAGSMTDESPLPRVELASVPGRGGILSHASVIATHTTVEDYRAAHRGRFVIENLLCQALPPPPPLDDIPPIPDDVSPREAFEAMTDSPGCQGCHSMINGAGFLFEHFDGGGAYHSAFAEYEVDASGVVDGEALDGVEDLGRMLAASKTAQLCMARRWFQFAVGRQEGPADFDSLQRALMSFQDAGLDLRELVASLLSSDAYRFRRLPE